MANLLNVLVPNIVVKDDHLYSEYTHVKPVVNKTSNGKYSLKNETDKFTIRTNLKVPKGNTISFKINELK